jgi:type VI secretion system secreted protein VgrG
MPAMGPPAPFPWWFARGAALVPTRVTVRGFNFENPPSNVQSSAGPTGGIDVSVFTSAVTALQDAVRQAQHRLERAALEGQFHTGASGVPAPRAGRLLTVSDALGGGLGGSYLVTSARHLALRDAQGTCFAYANEFRAIPASLPFRPARITPFPRLVGPVTAVVTGGGPGGTTLDEFGRTKVTFRFAETINFVSVWARVAIPPGRTGELFAPAIGSEVLVDFMEGDPNQPVVIGSLYNNTDQPPD